jgi:hypothetical protein
MYYEINVALNGTHYFATHERSITYIETAKKVFADFVKRFPKEEGFSISLTEWETRGKTIKTND